MKKLMSDNKLEYDYFDGDEVPAEEQQEESAEEREDREMEELEVVSPRDRYRDVVYAIIGATVALLAFLAWLLFYHPVVSEAQATGRLMKVECRGMVFKTFEGEMVSEQYVTDTIKRQSNDFLFSVETDSLSYRMMMLQNRGKKLTVVYKRYILPLPWRGSSKCIATDVIEH